MGQPRRLLSRLSHLFHWFAVNGRRLRFSMGKSPRSMSGAEADHDHHSLHIERRRRQKHRFSKRVRDYRTCGNPLLSNGVQKQTSGSHLTCPVKRGVITPQPNWGQYFAARRSLSAIDLSFRRDLIMAKPSAAPASGPSAGRFQPHPPPT